VGKGKGKLCRTRAELEGSGEAGQLAFQPKKKDVGKEQDLQTDKDIWQRGGSEGGATEES